MATPVDDAAIRDRAYYIWEREGCPQGRDQDHWAQAVRELQGEALAVEAAPAAAEPVAAVDPSAHAEPAAVAPAAPKPRKKAAGDTGTPVKVRKAKEPGAKEQAAGEPGEVGDTRSKASKTKAEDARDKPARKPTRKSAADAGDPDKKKRGKVKAAE